MVVSKKNKKNKINNIDLIFNNFKERKDIYLSLSSLQSLIKKKKIKDLSTEYIQNFLNLIEVLIGNNKPKELIIGIKLISPFYEYIKVKSIDIDFNPFSFLFNIFKREIKNKSENSINYSVILEVLKSIIECLNITSYYKEIKKDLFSQEDLEALSKFAEDSSNNIECRFYTSLILSLDKKSYLPLIGKVFNDILESPNIDLKRKVLKNLNLFFMEFMPGERIFSSESHFIYKGLIETLKDGYNPLDLRLEVAKVLLEIGNTAEPLNHLVKNAILKIFRESLEEQDPKIKTFSAQTLIEMNLYHRCINESLLDLSILKLLDVIENEKLSYKKKAVRLIKKSGLVYNRSDVIENVKSRLKKTNDKEIKERYYEVLSCGGEKAVPILIEGLKESDSDLRYHVIEQLSKCKRAIGFDNKIINEKIISALKEALNDESIKVSVKAEETLENSYAWKKDSQPKVNLKNILEKLYNYNDQISTNEKEKLLKKLKKVKSVEEKEKEFLIKILKKEKDIKIKHKLAKIISLLNIKDKDVPLEILDLVNIEDFKNGIKSKKKIKEYKEFFTSISLIKKENYFNIEDKEKILNLIETFKNIKTLNNDPELELYIIGAIFKLLLSYGYNEFLRNNNYKTKENIDEIEILKITALEIIPTLLERDNISDIKEIFGKKFRENIKEEEKFSNFYPCYGLFYLNVYHKLPSIRKIENLFNSLEVYSYFYGINHYDTYIELNSYKLYNPIFIDIFIKAFIKLKIFEYCGLLKDEKFKHEKEVIEKHTWIPSYHVLNTDKIHFQKDGIPKKETKILLGISFYLNRDQEIQIKNDYIQVRCGAFIYKDCFNRTKCEYKDYYFLYYYKNKDCKALFQITPKDVEGIKNNKEPNFHEKIKYLNFYSNIVSIKLKYNNKKIKDKKIRELYEKSELLLEKIEKLFNKHGINFNNIRNEDEENSEKFRKHLNIILKRIEILPNEFHKKFKSISNEFMKELLNIN